MASSPTQAGQFDQQDHLDVIDALRGYAILLVIAVHTAGRIPELVWPAKRVMLLGFYGVQLFFLASAVTLLMSWQRSTDAFPVRSSKFLIRRFFRIAPLYYLAIPLYWIAYQTPADQFQLSSLFATLGFYNAFSPYFIPTVPGWTPVPGGWSIGVEFSFYFLFPFLAISITSLRHALGFLLFGVLLLLLVGHFGPGLYPEISDEARVSFLYFCPFNQLVIFALGFVLYHCVKHPDVSAWLRRSPITADRATLALIPALIALSFYGIHKTFNPATGLPPTHLLASLLFLGWALVLINKPRGWVINRAIVGLGKVSFSAYVLHFMVLNFAGMSMRAIWPLPVDGVWSIPFTALFLALTLLGTRLLAGATYRAVEQPCIDAGKTLINKLFRRVQVLPAG